MRSLDALESSLIVPRRFTLEEYRRLLHVGVLGEDEHVELLEGLIVDMAPQGRPHALVISRMSESFMAARRPDCRVRVQLPLSLGTDSEPEPDLAVVTREEEEHAQEHPSTALLVVEVAVDSLRVDRMLKGRLYARAGIPEYWVVDVAGRAVEVYIAPDTSQGRYLGIRTVAAGEPLGSPALPGLALQVAELFA
ncbi:Uma2 family endonuclease [Hyalangium gracile]|uniref:Uma2 family endonuclease n=1 Tax=Hyalangium gracile TaxID=394092 RepID=UPI001CCE6222|nr:Uma2 family endonuclease [Hyalangium gracile]